MIRARRDERGAVAIMAAILAGVLLLTAALAVELGNGWARERTAQKQVDVVAMAAAHWAVDNDHAPWDSDADKNAIAAEAARFIVDEDFNGVAGQDDISAATLATRLRNGDVSDGELVFDDDTTMRLVSPPARVNFSFAQAAPEGPDGVDVRAGATVRLFSEVPGNDVMPLWMPSGCPYGSAEGDTTNTGNGNGGGNGNGNNTPTPTPTPTPTASPTATATTSAPPNGNGTGVDASRPVYLTSSAFQDVQANSTVVVELTLTPGPGYSAFNLRKQVDPLVHFQFSDGTRFDVTGAWFPANPSGSTAWTMRVTVNPANITSRPGAWMYQVRAGQQLQGSNWQPVYTGVGTFQVVGPTPTASPTSPTPTATATPSPTATSSEQFNTFCPGASTGNFGQLNSPRQGMGFGSRNTRLAMNFQQGIDHVLTPYVNAPSNSCENPTGQTLAVLDDYNGSVVNGANCIVGDTGNDGPFIFNGLIDGIGGQPGRLNVVNGATKSDCNRPAASLGGVNINNDTLSCYLLNGHSLADISQSSGVDTTMLDPAVVNSPRFIWIPIVRAADRSEHDYQPIIRFVPGFFTDETASSTKGSSNATASNGLICNGGGTCNSFSKLVVYTFNPDALQERDRNPVVEYDPTVGRPLPLLVD